MKFRICKTDNKYFIQGKRFFKWKTLPDLEHYLMDYTSFLFTATYNTFEDAYKELTQFKIRFCKPESFVIEQ